MSYREKTPTVVSILTRRLKDGYTFDDFQKAHVPDGDHYQKLENGHQVNFFTLPTRVINAVSYKDPRVIISIGFSYGDGESIFADAMAGAANDKARVDRLNEICEKIEETKFGHVGNDNNYGGSGVDHEQAPLLDVSNQDVFAAIQAALGGK
ncbi:MAG: hypothetical protein AAGJ81_14300 [Verrucomicrobiota bacterium]